MRTVVLCGSLGLPVAMWEPQIAALAAGFRVVTVDHPGHGGAPVVPVDDVADLARHVLEQVPEGRFSFVGLSLGGAVGLRLALDEPGRLDRLALLCTAAYFGPPEGWLERAALVREQGVEAVAETVLDRFFTPQFPDVERYRRMFLATDPEGYARCCDALRRFDVRDDLSRIGVPTLAVAASDDPSTPPERLELIAERVPGARLETIEGARHLVTAERPDDVNRLLLSHLS